MKTEIEHDPASATFCGGTFATLIALSSNFLGLRSWTKGALIFAIVSFIVTLMIIIKRDTKEVKK